MNTLSATCLFLLALIHLLPAIGVLGPAHLVRLYAIAPPDAEVTLLLRHRAILFGLLGGFCIGACVVPAWRAPAFVAAGISVTSYLALLPTGANPALTRVAWVDRIAVAVLVVGVAAELAHRLDGP